MTTRAAIYCRISRDRNRLALADGENPEAPALGVKRQEKDCRAYCKTRGWDVARVFSENDTSAYSGKRRPLYEELLAGIDDGDFDALVVWHPDRLHRSPLELEHFIALVERTGIEVATVTAGSYDLGNPDGRMTARITGAVARKESEDKSRRIRRKHLELAEGGQVSGGGMRPFGYEKDRLTVVPAEAKVIKEAAASVLAGESLRSVAASLNDRGVATVTGTRWSAPTLKRLLMSARISGQREHRGQNAVDAAWPPIIDPLDTVRLRALLTDPARRTSTRVHDQYLLTGFLRCGGCGAGMHGNPVIRKGHRYRRYSCSTPTGCGRVGINTDRLDELITEAVLGQVERAGVAKGVAAARKRKADGKAGPVDEVAEIERLMEQQAEMFVEGKVNRATLEKISAGLDARMKAARAAVADETRETAVEPLLTADLRSEWPGLSTDRKRAVVAALIDHVEIAPTKPGDARFDAGRVNVAWRA